MQDKELNPFWVNAQEGKYRVIDGSDYTWLEAANEQTAEHYTDLLNKAFKSGYKNGYRHGRIANRNV